MFVAHGDGQRDHFDVNGDGGNRFLSPHRWADAGKSDQRDDHRTNDHRRDDRRTNDRRKGNRLPPARRCAPR